MGGYAVVITTMVINLVHLVDSPLYAGYCLHRNGKIFYPVIFLHIFSGVIQVLIAFSLKIFYPYATDWLSLILKVSLFAVIGLCVCMITNITKKERYLIVSKLGIREKNQD